MNKYISYKKYIFYTLCTFLLCIGISYSYYKNTRNTTSETISFTPYNKEKHQNHIVTIAKNTKGQAYGSIASPTSQTSSLLFDDMYKAILLKDLENKDLHTIVLEKNNNVIGFITFGKTKILTLDKLLQELRSQGISHIDISQLTSLFPFIPEYSDDYEPFIIIDSIAIDPYYQKKGYGTKLIKHTFKEIEKLYPTYKIVALDVEQDNSEACAFYEKIGFKKTKSQDTLSDILNIYHYEYQL